MKHLIAFLLSCVSVSVLLAQAEHSKSSLRLLHASPEETLLEFTLSGVDFHTVSTPQGAAVTISIDGGTPLLQEGAPDLPKYAFSLRLPAQGDAVVEVLEARYTEYTDVLVAPSKGNLLRTVDPASVPYSFGSVYAKDALFPVTGLEAQAPFVLRGARGQAVWLYPVHYNPQSKVLNVCTRMLIRVRPSEGPGTNALKRDPVELASPVFDQLYEKLFINNFVYESLNTALEPEQMLVIARSDFLDALEPLLTWKRQMGIHTVAVTTDEIGGTDANTIYNYVYEYYQDHPISYLLLAGDEYAIAPQMRPSGSAMYSCDNCFGYMDGNDHLPEILVGRFNAETIDQLKVMVARNLDYEITPLTDSVENWTATALAACSNEGAGIGDDNQADWEHGNEWKINHLADGFEKVWEFFDGNHAADSPTPGDISADLPGNPVNTQIVDLMNTRGISLYNYTGHGWEQGLASGNFNTQAVAQLRNKHRYPILIAVACCAGNFTNNGAGDCLGEAFQRAGNPASAEAWGGIAGFFSSDFQSWSPPMEGQDGMNQYLLDADGIDLRPSICGMAAFGNARMIIAYGANGELMADFWNPFTEPSTVPRTRMALPLSATHPGFLPFGSTALSVQCPEEGALAALYLQGQTLAVARVENGVADFSFLPLKTVGTLTLTVTQFNRLPYQAELTLLPPNGPFVVHQELALDDSAGNGDGQADFGELIRLDLTLANVGQSLATATFAQLSSADPGVVLLDDYELFGDLEDSTALLREQAFSLEVMADVEDGQRVAFELLVGFSDTGFYSLPFEWKLRAPVLEIASFSIDDTQNGNGNGRLESGETALVRIKNRNTGNSASPVATGVLTSNSPYLEISPAVDLGVLAAQVGSADAVFEVAVSDLAPAALPAIFDYDLAAGAYGANAQFGPFLLNAIVEPFETHNFNSFPWEMAGSKPWSISTFQPYEGLYCARSGSITHNEETRLSISLNVSADGFVQFARRVSSEPDYDFLRFSIDGVELGAWSGEVPWGEVSFPVSAGLHTLTWTYAKDGIGGAGSDRAWVDDILLPPHQVVVSADGGQQAGGPAFRVYPNPFTDRITLLQSGPASLLEEVAVFDGTGRQVWQMPAGQRDDREQLVLELPGLPLGIYLLKVRTASGVDVFKLVRQ